MATKKKSERTFEATKKYNEYMRSRYAKKRQAEGKIYSPRPSMLTRAQEQTELDDQSKEILNKVLGGGLSGRSDGDED